MCIYTTGTMHTAQFIRILNQLRIKFWIWMRNSLYIYLNQPVMEFIENYRANWKFHVFRMPRPNTFHIRHYEPNERMSLGRYCVCIAYILYIKVNKSHNTRMEAQRGDYV
jgi:hypothetical protein